MQSTNYLPHWVELAAGWRKDAVSLAARETWGLPTCRLARTSPGGAASESETLAVPQLGRSCVAFVERGKNARIANRNRALSSSPAPAAVARAGSAGGGWPWSELDDAPCIVASSILVTACQARPCSQVPAQLPTGLPRRRRPSQVPHLSRRQPSRARSSSAFADRRGALRRDPSQVKKPTPQACRDQNDVKITANAVTRILARHGWAARPAAAKNEVVRRWQRGNVGGYTEQAECVVCR